MKATPVLLLLLLSLLFCPSCEENDQAPIIYSRPSETNGDSGEQLGSGESCEEGIASIRISDKSGTDQVDVPIRIGRVFKQGDIPDYPIAALDGVTIETQANVQTRWSDDSVKHAVISFYLPNLAADSTATVTFCNQAGGNTDQVESVTDMLLSHYDFEAGMRLGHNQTDLTVSARQMLQDRHFEYVNAGKVATTIVLADHSLERTYDIGFDEHRSLRPLFIATFWPLISAVDIRMIMEISNTEVLQDQQYDLSLTLGHSDPQTVYQQAAVNHTAMSRWSKRFRHNGADPRIAIDHDAAYLVSTSLIPNYDLSKQPPANYDSWNTADKDLFDPGNWTKAMPTTGGRPDIGPYPDWVVNWLYTMDHQVGEMVLGNADLAAAWPIHVREGRGDRWFDHEQTVNALGKVVSGAARPTAWLAPGRLDWAYTEPEDRLTTVGACTDNGFQPDTAHQPDPFSIAYMLTGDVFYLEQLYFWAAWGVLSSNPCDAIAPYCKGPLASGGLTEQLRGEAWVLRTRGRAAVLAPDGSAEKKVFSRWVNDALAIMEGQRDIQNGAFFGSAMWNWGQTNKTRWGDLGIHPLRIWDRGGAAWVNSAKLDTDVTKEAFSPWEIHFLLFSLGHLAELGFASQALVEWAGVSIIDQLTTPGYDPYLIGMDRLPTVDKRTDAYFNDWLTLQQGYSGSLDASADFRATAADPIHGYANIALPAISYVVDRGLPKSDQARQWAETNILSGAALNGNPKWAIKPRSAE
jgi:hypothetical protein